MNGAADQSCLFHLIICCWVCTSKQVTHTDVFLCNCLQMLAWKPIYLFSIVISCLIDFPAIALSVAQCASRESAYIKARERSIL
ncbi:hypothetical protein BJV82DRAFT_67397 [Fennellomyces sp. T-0311]|nr:hypothetical protein BJV82DRAFT_67397 [Fennellomyces sp. T-0311]